MPLPVGWAVTVGLRVWVLLSLQAPQADHEKTQSELTVIVSEKELLPALFVAVTAYAWLAAPADGVPEMTPVELDSASPPGRDGDTA